MKREYSGQIFEKMIKYQIS